MRISTLGLAIIAMTLVGASSAETIVLRPRYEAGQRHYVEGELTFEQGIRGGMAGQEGAKWRIQMTTGLWVSVDSVSATEGTRLVLTFDRSRESVESTGYTASYDSDVTPAGQGDPTLEPVLAPLIGESARCLLNPDGEVLSFEGMEKVHDKIAASVAATPAAKRSFQEMEHLFSNEFMRVAWVESVLVIFPRKPVSVGDQWEGTVRHPHQLMGELVYTYRCSLQEVKGEGDARTAVVRYEGDMRTAEGATPKPNAAGMLISLEQGSFKGNATFDIARGMMLLADEDGTIRVNVKKPPAEGVAEATLSLDRTFRQSTRWMSPEARSAEKEARRAATRTESAPAGVK